MEVKIKKLREEAIVPTYGSSLAAGADLYSCVDMVINPGETKLVPTGIAFAIPEGYGMFIYARSSLATKEGLAPANKVGVVDADYRGEVFVSLYNHSSLVRNIEKGQRIAQMVVAPFIKAEFICCDELDETDRGAGAFGSTGKK